MKIKTFLTILLVGIMVFIAACKKDIFNPFTNVCPLILQSNPPDGTTGVPLDKVISVTFNKDMDAMSITDLSFYVLGSVVPGTITYENKVASFTPSQPLLQNHTYVGYVKTLVKDHTGNHLQKEFTWTFSTGMVINPMVISTSPVNLEADVATNKTISAQAKNIYWQIGSSATLGGYTIFKGNILALTSITMGVYSVADGRMLARNGAVSMVSTNIINKP